MCVAWFSSNSVCLFSQGLTLDIVVLDVVNTTTHYLALNSVFVHNLPSAQSLSWPSCAEQKGKAKQSRVRQTKPRSLRRANRNIETFSEKIVVKFKKQKKII